MKNLISALLIFLPFIGLSQYKPMNQPYQFNAQTKFADTVFLDTAMQGQGVFLVMDTLTGELKRDTVSIAINGDSILNIVRANVDTSGTLNLQQVTDNDSTTDNKITITNSFEQGFGTNAAGVYSHAEGIDTESGGDYSHAEGRESASNGNYSHAEGASTSSSGDYSHAEGIGAVSSGDYSHAEGSSTEAFSYAEKSQGVFTTTYTPSSTTSIVSTDRIWAIGNGTGTFARNNALTMLKNGTTTIDTTWSYASDMSGFAFSGLDIPSTEYVRNENEKQTGWAQYSDTTFTVGSPFSVLEGDTAVLPNDAGSVITTYLPSDVDSLYSPSDTEIVASGVGDAYTLRINFGTTTSVVSGYFTLIVDIGNGTPEVITARTFTYPKGSGVVHAYSTTNLIYSLNTFVTNGAKIKIIGGSGTTDIFNISYVIAKIHNAN